MKLITIKEIALDLEMEPKKARRILRKSGLKKNSSNWIFDSKEANKIKEILSTAPSKKEKEVEVA